MTELDDNGPRVPVRCGTMLLGASPEEADRIANAWRQAELARVAWLRALDEPTHDQLLEADLIEAQHQHEDALNRFGPTGGQTQAAMEETSYLLEIMNGRELARHDWQELVREAVEMELAEDRFLQWRWLTYVCPAKRSILALRDWY
ncbi:MAG TPA: hypothetical protein VMQ11_18155 [Alphaproteobacteria bacterium]|nr:hypothetical protein [Alphaproteobacteria bacterium]HTY70322.1 hypothetical protein [Alphaproteobacteria bacterium]